jgi:primosomal protein N' (replication factor Y)
MVAKGLDLPLVTLVGVVLADYTLREADFRARERTYQMLVQVAGRAGRAERDGRVIVQTLQPDHPAILAAAQYRGDAFFEEELAWRHAHGHPPFRRLVRLLFSHANATYAIEEAARFAEELRALAAGRPGVEVLGPLVPGVARVRGRHRWSLLVRADDDPTDLLRDLETLPPGWAIDVDPLTLD